MLLRHSITSSSPLGHVQTPCRLSTIDLRRAGPSISRIVQGRGQMKTVEQYLEHAKECDDLARKAVTADERKAIQGMAATWRMLAEERAQKLANGPAPRDGKPGSSK
jgi:DNA-binding FrmR family transcriptional regulator